MSNALSFPSSFSQPRRQRKGEVQSKGQEVHPALETPHGGLGLGAPPRLSVGSGWWCSSWALLERGNARDRSGKSQLHPEKGQGGQRTPSGAPAVPEGCSSLLSSLSS